MPGFLKKTEGIHENINWEKVWGNPLIYHIQVQISLNFYISDHSVNIWLTTFFSGIFRKFSFNWSEDWKFSCLNVKKLSSEKKTGFSHSQSPCHTSWNFTHWKTFNTISDWRLWWLTPALHCATNSSYLAAFQLYIT